MPLPKRLLLAIHDVSFPADPDEDVGRGSPYTRASRRFLRFVRSLGFTGLQLGPQGQTSADNPSPYDGTFFSRNVDSTPLAAFIDADSPYAGLVPPEELAAAVIPSGGNRADHPRAHAALHRITRLAYEALPTRPDLGARLDRFAAQHAEWLKRDGLYDALRESYGDKGFRDWPENGDLDFWRASSRPRREALLAQHARHLHRYAFQQLIAHDVHERFRADAAAEGLVLYADLQIGTSDADAWARAPWFLRDYVMGAPPSRTNPEGQPWGYGVIDPALVDIDGEPSFFLARIEKAFAEYDSLRVDHPHGIVCPWVYRTGTSDPHAAVIAGARLHESPDLPDHPSLAQYAITRPEQINRSVPRFDDDWVITLDQAQIDRYAQHFDALVAAAKRNGRLPESLSCEVLSTDPHPLTSVLERHGLGRFRVTQKANLDDRNDGYRSENAEPPDWAMVGNHDTRPIFALVHEWSPERRAKWAAHLTGVLGLDPAARARVESEPGALAQAMLDELFACNAENVSIFYGDLFGERESFNVPGSVGAHNWTLRLPPDFDALYTQRVSRDEALDVKRALDDVRGSTRTR